MKTTLRSLFISLVLALPACGGAPAEPAKAPPSSGLTLEGQVSAGGQLYGANCASCHGKAGEGGMFAPAVVGEGALPRVAPEDRDRTVEFNSALDVFRYVRDNMPPRGPKAKQLKDDEYAAIVAFALAESGQPLSAPLLEGNAGAIALSK